MTWKCCGMMCFFFYVMWRGGGVVRAVAEGQVAECRAPVEKTRTPAETENRRPASHYQGALRRISKPQWGPRSARQNTPSGRLVDTA